MTLERKLIALFFISNQTPIRYYQVDDKYHFKEGIGKPVLSSSQGDIDKAKLEIAQIFKVPSEGIMRIR